MTLISDYAVAAVFAMIIAIVQVVMIMMLGDGTQLHALADEATNLRGAETADWYYKIAAVWVPLIGYGICGAFPLVRAYRRQALTARQRPP